MEIVNFLLYVLLVPLAVFGTSQLLDKWCGRSGNTWLLITACLLFSLAYFLPSPYIHGRDTQFMMHVVGGGLFCGFLWAYHRTKLRLPHGWYWEIGSLFVLVSTLGVLNELYELFAYEFLDGMQVLDTSYDLLANTLGVAIFYGVYATILHTSRK